MPALSINEPEQVVTIRQQEAGELVSSLCIQGTQYQPKVLQKGTYSIEIGEGVKKQWIREVIAKKGSSIQNIEIEL